MILSTTAGISTPYNFHYNAAIMAFAQEQQEALHILQAIENGIMPLSGVAQLLDEADPALVYLILTWLRSRYGADHPAAEAVIGRILKLTSDHPRIRAKMREGKCDPIATWFEEEHSYRDFSATGFIELVVEKLEG